MKKNLLLLTILILTSSCGTVSNTQYKNFSAGEIGCLPDEIQIEGAKTVVWGSIDPWVAKCKGQEFICGIAGTKASCKKRI